MNEAVDKWYIEQLTAPALMNRNAVRFGHKLFQWWRTGPDATESITYARGWQIIRDCSSGLLDMDFRKGDRAAIMSHTSPQWVWADFAILCAGGVTVTIYPTLSEKEMAFIINDSGSRIIFVQDEEILVKALAVMKECPTLEKIVVMKDHFDHAGDQILDLERLMDRGVRFLVREPFAFELRWRSVTLLDRMTIVYTSGTTGIPKGVVHTHLSFNAAMCRDLRMAPNFRGDEVVLSFLPISHTYERECGHGCALMGAACIAYSSAKTIVEDFKVFRPHLFMSVPRIYERIYMAMRDQAAKSPVKNFIFNAALKTGLKVINSRSDTHGFVDMSEGIDMTAGIGFWLRFKFRLFDRLLFSKVRALLGGRFRFAFSAAGALPADLCRTFMAMGIRIIEGYGATETWNTVNLNRLDKVLPGSVGPAVAGVQGRIAEDGEWQVKGDNIFKEYWNNPQATAEAFTDDGYYRTGDIVEPVADGYVRIVDRKKGLMVLDTGKNIPAAKIEGLFSLSACIEILFPVADDRKFVSALVVPNFDYFIKYFSEKGIPYDESKLEYYLDGPLKTCVKVGDDFIENADLRALVDRDIQQANQFLEEFEKIKQYRIIARKFTEQSGEMTPTLKVKRKIVLTNFASDIEGMYNK